MSAIPNQPRVMKGAILALDPFNPIASVIIFQYNPAELTRTLTPVAQTDPQTAVGTLRLSGPPQESISLKVMINAADQLDAGDAVATRAGIYPQLAALEMLLYPKSTLVIANRVLAALGTLEIEPPQAPLTIFVWGIKRVVPVRLKTYSVTEQYHDANLNPIVAEASLGLDVLSYADFLPTQKGYYLFLAHQVMKEAMATIGSLQNLSSVANGQVKL